MLEEVGLYNEFVTNKKRQDEENYSNWSDR